LLWGRRLVPLPLTLPGEPFLAFGVATGREGLGPLFLQLASVLFSQGAVFSMYNLRACSHWTAAWADNNQTWPGLNAG